MKLILIFINLKNYEIFMKMIFYKFYKYEKNKFSKKNKFQK